jgi:hypothetical protein
MSSIVWLNPLSSSHTYGLEIFSSDKYTVENFVYNQIVDVCKKFDCKYFVQGFQIREYKSSWAFVEFLGEGNQDKILQVIEYFNKCFGSSYYGSEVQLDEPSRELLEDLKLI